ncbi:type II toxin-antitoxin system RelB/DinJ family antitoxin [Patescibacteria group bacterium]|nr:type II toxin-antitoxin system RelB/DinJ family antitoxin [Patescibacteria group bacterium]MBU4601358.1 type II toxin-antitoxin system RelB/DinJ family antitoxin [Patescibacteria group bacterium]MCG2698801.1 type II toxin-antitoxin system RelB/DinJ family antitoxin [Candidatus Parcubacteria bacterium]
MIKTNQKANNQIQVRIDSKTKKETQRILESLGLDISTAVKMLFKQIINTGGLPYEIRDENGFTFRKKQELKQAIVEAKTSSKTFDSADKLIKDALA